MTTIKPAAGPLLADILRLWLWRDLVLIFIVRDIKVRYVQTLLGPAWVLLQPIALTGLVTVLINGVVQVKTGNVPPILFNFSGFIAWTYFSQILQTVGNVFVDNEYTFSRVYFPRLAMPIASVTSSAVGVTIQTALTIALLLAYRGAGIYDGLSLRIVLFPLIFLQLMIFSLGVGLWISCLTAKYRDLRITLPLIIQLWFIGSPVMYGLDSVAERYRLLFCGLNPLAAIMENCRWCLVGGSGVGVGEVMASLVTTILVAGSGLLLFSRVERTVVDTI